AVYEGLPKLILLKDEAEKIAVSYAKQTFGFDFSMVFYDVTTLYYESFREDINRELLTGDFVIKDVTIRPNSQNDEYTVIFGIISKSDSGLDIPFFSKMTLVHVSKSLINLGFKIALIKIKNLIPNKNDN
ncbi:MAG TPA: TIGR04141 family sporadically distributed protein, partial [Patescibacteria group bacterium]|nr:TIGR04141 family sporadically distributed protein [Patescibacteria group bacterium]